MHFLHFWGEGSGEDGNGNTKMAETSTEIAFRRILNQHSANASTNI